MYIYIGSFIPPPIPPTCISMNRKQINQYRPSAFAVASSAGAQWYLKTKLKVMPFKKVNSLFWGSYEGGK